VQEMANAIAQLGQRPVFVGGDLHRLASSISYCDILEQYGNEAGSRE